MITVYDQWMPCMICTGKIAIDAAPGCGSKFEKKVCHTLPDVVKGVPHLVECGTPSRLIDHNLLRSHFTGRTQTQDIHPCRQIAYFQTCSVKTSMDHLLLMLQCFAFQAQQTQR